MSIDTRGSIIDAAQDRKVRWAGRILVVVGTGHLLGAFALTVRDHAHRWFSAELWRLDEGILDMSPAMAAFWLTTGSFGVPLILLGALVLWLDRQGIAPPRFVAWMLVAWSAMAAVIVEPAPWAVITVAGGLLLAAARPSPHQAGRTPPSKV
jgi:hypothetical protein